MTSNLEAVIDFQKLKSSRLLQKNEDGSSILIEIKQEEPEIDNESDIYRLGSKVVPDVLRDETNSNDVNDIIDLDLENQSLNDEVDSTDYIVTYCTECTLTSKYEFIKNKERTKECTKCRTALKYKCPDCSKLYSSLNHARRHHKFVCGKQPRFSCSQCDFKANTGFNMNIHMKSKHRPRGPKENLCCKCGLMYETYRYLLQHEKRCGIPSDVKRQTKKYRFFCDNCDYKCEEKIRIKRHMEHVHSTADNVSCSICGRVFKFKKYLENHRIISNRCAKKALEMDKIENIPLSKRNKKKVLEKKLKNKNENQITSEEQEKKSQKDVRKPQKVEQEKKSQKDVRKPQEVEQEKKSQKDVRKPQEVEQEKEFLTKTRSLRTKNVINYKKLTRERF